MTFAVPLVDESATAAGKEPLTEDEFLAALMKIGEERYHSLHPFHKLLHGGKLNYGQVQAWAVNRFYYQLSIPRKDAALISRLHDHKLRRLWRSRIIDHDGDEQNEGGIERFLHLTDALGLDREYILSTRGILPGTRFAVEAYVNFVRERSILEAIASSLTELFAPAIHEERIAGLLKHYDFANDVTLSYFRKRLTEARQDVEFGRAYVLTHAKTRDQQEAVLNAVRFKTDVLWSQLDALHFAYVEPALIPPGAFVPEDRK
ncbi:MAG: pyrroloquinoline quinone biosynthesis protein C [Rhodospirillaceae bacterium]|nr:pyrroloquinoline quinone biosynthesis protein C [Rhodospirillaceae bacterium]